MANLYSKFIFDKSYFPNKCYPSSYSEGKVRISQYSLTEVKMLFYHAPTFLPCSLELLEYKKAKPSH